ncbi:MAG TPA: DUF1553 domain-containing protein [Gemmataceae bacterium]|jgi:mono/diheme cytochrome c family protein|nr:DUF1553 domain-containing protein [Gemmataceae bacterium]
MRRRTGLALALLTALLVPAARADAANAADFESAFARVVVKNCVNCHNATDLKGRLDLTQRQTLLKGGKSGPVVVAGKPDESYLIERVTEGSMPPKGKGRRLSAQEVEALRAWVANGAPWPAGRILSPFEFTTERRAGYDWWSLQPLTRPSLPNCRGDNAIDAFLIARLQEHGLSLAPPADKGTYLRRAKFDLLGLPPTPEEIDAFVADNAPDAYSRLIDRLLASPHYGEHWGRHWLDVARFGESDGFENDRMREHAWRYRDYVIRSFNEDKPYPQFTKEQLAGDMLQPITRDGLIATGFLVAGPWDEIQNVAQSKTEKMRTHEEEMEELIGAVAQTFLGMTVNCARCHDHKFDPIPQRDYYRMKAVFDGVEHGHRPILLPDEEKAVAPLQSQIQVIKSRLLELDRAAAAKEVQPAVNAEALRKSLRADLKQKQAEWDARAVPVSYSGVMRQPEPTVIYVRGDIRKPGAPVTAGGLSPVRTTSSEFQLPADAPEGVRRLCFAEWAARHDNPLTARVMVNRIWQYHFGHGLIDTPSDFGFNGGRPSHPELLDWLAQRFIADGWSVKKMHRLIMLSAGYRQSARFDPKAAAIDTDNRLLWRFAPRRLEAETVRDSMLAVSGELNSQIGGPSFKPFTTTVFNTTFYHLFDRGTPEFNRRTIYRMLVNTARSALLDSLDCPSPSVAAPQRRNTTTPLQALALMNDSFVQRQANRFCQRVERAAGANRDAQIALAYRLAFGRAPTATEELAANELCRDSGLESFCWVLLNASEFLYSR